VDEDLEDVDIEDLAEESDALNQNEVARGRPMRKISKTNTCSSWLRRERKRSENDKPSGD
jgi:hypothetical protein